MIFLLLILLVVGTVLYLKYCRDIANDSIDRDAFFFGTLFVGFMILILLIGLAGGSQYDKHAAVRKIYAHQRIIARYRDIPRTTDSNWLEKGDRAFRYMRVYLNIEKHEKLKAEVKSCTALNRVLLYPFY